ncbi:MAG: 50S ribosomal protein L18 [Candidatus Bathyarchaeia archaeon]
MRRLRTLPLRRRREKKTDYRARKTLILSGLPRLVVRNFAKNTWVQVVEARPEGDRVLASASTKRLIKEFGWRGGGGNTPAAYLTGLLAGVTAGRKGVKEAVLDTGPLGLVKGSRTSAALKGALDAGLKLPYSEEVLPEDERIEGVHIAKYAETLLREDPELYRKRFSAYLSRGLEPTSLAEHFREVRGKVIG